MVDRAKIHTFLIPVIVVFCLKHISFDKESKLITGSQDYNLNFTETAARNLYKSEEHTVVTEDGYVLTVFRMTEARKCKRKKKQRPVLIMHGLLENSDVFLDAGPSAGLAYLLAAACHDVWAGNQRGNNYGRRHLALDPDRDAAFWQFTINEMGVYDIPATFDYIMNVTGADKVNYIGFSQGGGTYFVMCSERPDYCKKSAVMIGLAPAVTFENMQSITFKLIIWTVMYLRRIFLLFGVQEVFRKDQLLHEIPEYICQSRGSLLTDIFCETCGFADNYHPGSISPSTRRLVFTHFLTGTSLDNLIRYGQVLQSGKFQKLDYGEQINLERYNSSQPPEYNLSAVTTPVVLIQGKNDMLVNFLDTVILSTKLGNVLEFVEVSDPNWTHLDMAYSQDIRAMIYPKINYYLQMYTYIDK